MNVKRLIGIFLMLGAVISISGVASADTFSSNLFPAFQAMSISGSSLDISSGSFSSGVLSSFVGSQGSLSPSLGYSTSLTGVSGFPAMGSISSFMNFHGQQGNVFDNGDGTFTIGLGSDISYSSSASATGLISAFSTSYSSII